MTTENSLIYLVSCAINEKTPEKSIIDKMNISEVYSLAEKHMLSTAVAMALESAGYENEHSIKTIGFSLRKISLLEADKIAVFKKFEEAEIWYMPLKGAVLKDFYPRLGMREMSDYDILFDAQKTEDVKKIMEELGFVTHTFGSYNEDGYRKSPLTFFEMHRTLFGARHGKTICDYYADVKTRLIKDNNNQYGFHYCFHLTQEDFYIYIVAHEYSHYSAAGTGLRSLLDTYVFLKKHELNWDYISTEISKLGISDFEKANRNLSLSLFNGKELTENEKTMLNYILSSGTYGTIESIETNANKKIAEYGRFKYFLKRLTLPYPQMLEEYPVLKKAPFLYPLCWLSRLFIRGLFLRRKQFLSQLKALLNWNI